MSKRDKPRLVSVPDFKEVRQADAEGKTTLSTPLKSDAVMIEDPDEDEGPSFFHKIGAFFAGCWEKVSAFSKAAVSKTWEWCRSTALWTWGGLRKLPSYCVIRWDAEDETEPAKTDAKNVPVKAPAVTVSEQGDEDEFTPSRWWNIGIKSAAVAAAALVLVGGYFAVQSFIGTKNTTEVAVDAQKTSEPTDQPLAALSAAATPVPIPDTFSNTPAAAVAEPAIVPEPQPESQPQESSLFGDNPFSAPSVPTIPVTHDFGATLETTAEQPAPIARTVPVETVAAPQTLPALQPVESVQIADVQPQLQPLVELDTAILDSSAFPSAAPMAAEAPVKASIASNYAPPTQPRGTASKQRFSNAPTPPPVADTIPQTVIEPTIPITKPIKEIVPHIPHMGTIEDVPPPAAVASVTPSVAAEPHAKYAPPVADASTMRTLYSNESAPAIPKDAPIQATPTVVAVPPPQNVLPDNLPIDNQLWEQIRALRNEPEAEPTKLRFDSANEPATAEPALRFTPRQTAPPTDETNLLSSGTEAFKGLQLDDLDPDSQNIIAAMLPVQAAAPKPAFAEVRAAYREDFPGQSEGEQVVTFRNRQLEMRRSGVRYIVQEGDTVFRLATDKLKDSTRWREILAMNEDRLQSVRDLKPGMEILLPVETARLNRQRPY